LRGETSMRVVNTETIDILSRALDALSLRHAAIAHNIANVNTPGYKRYTVRFEEFLARELSGESLRLARTHPRHRANAGTAAARPIVERQLGGSIRPDGNNVDIDLEMAALSQNAILYQALIGQLAWQLRALKTAISEGRR